MKKSFLHARDGFSLVELMVVAGLSSVMALAFTQLTLNGQRSLESQIISSELVDFGSRLRLAISKSDNCGSALSVVSFTPAASGAQTAVNLSQISIAGVGSLQVGADGPGGKFKVDSLQIKELLCNPATAVDQSCTSTARLTFRFSKKVFIGSKYSETSIPIMVTAKSQSDLSYKIQECDAAPSNLEGICSAIGLSVATDGTRCATTFPNGGSVFACLVEGGRIVMKPGTQSEICKIPRPACPTNWLPANVTATTANTCVDNGFCSGGSRQCTTGAHSFSNTAQETCGYAHHYWNIWGCHGSPRTCSANIIAIGCLPPPM